MAFLGPYYHGKYKWDNYLLDIQETIKSESTKQRSLQEDALDVAREAGDELRRQTARLEHIEDALDGGFEALRSEFEWGFTLMVDRMEPDRSTATVL